MTLRTRLILSSTGVLALALVSFGAVTVFWNRGQAESAIDRDLLRRAEAASRFVPGPMRGLEPFAPYLSPRGGPEGRRGPDGPNPDRPNPDRPNPDRPRGPGGPGGPGRGGPPPIDDPRTAFGLALFLNERGEVVRPRVVEEPYDPALSQVRQPVYSLKVLEGQRVRVLAHPWQSPEGATGVVQVARSLREVDDAEQRLIQVLAGLLPLALLAAGGLGYVLTSRGLAPLENVTRTTSEANLDGPIPRIPVVRDDEVGKLATSFNAMFDRLKLTLLERDAASARLREALESQRRFVADASHELRTPLTRLKLATTGPFPTLELAEESLRVADEAADAMSRLVQELLILSRADAGELKPNLSPSDLRVVVAQAFDVLRTHGRVALDLGEAEVIVLADSWLIRRVVTNLLENALRHTTENRRITVTVRPEGRFAWIKVRDDGEGIPAEHLPHVFERFYQADRSRTGAGTGLGLAICKSIIEAHGGTITLESEPGAGTLALVRLPLSARERSSQIPHEPRSK